MNHLKHYSTELKLKNIPVSLSLLHEQEYNNLCSFFKKRRAYSEKYKIHKSHSTLYILHSSCSTIYSSL